MESFCLYLKQKFVKGTGLERVGLQRMLTEERIEDLEQPERLRERRRQRKKKNLSTIMLVVSVLLFLTVVIISIVLYIWVDKKLQKSAKEAAALSEAVENQTEAISEEELAQLLEQARREGADEVLVNLAESINSSSSITNALRPLYKDQLVVASEGAYHFIPINPDLKKNDYKEENLRILSNGLVEYVENDIVISHKGIDVSKHQGEIDWAKVAADGVEFVFIRVGNRGYGSGAIVEDPQFEANVVGALSNGIKVGVYFFSQAITVEEAQEEARFVLEKIAPYKINCPIVLDVEKVADSEARMNKISTQQRTANTLAFLQAVEAAGYKTMLYHNMEMGTLKLDMTQFEEYQKWFAYYNKELYYPYAYDVWQYTDKGKVDGISGDVDMNISFTLWE